MFRGRGVSGQNLMCLANLAFKGLKADMIQRLCISKNGTNSERMKMHIKQYTAELTIKGGREWERLVSRQ